MKVKGDTAIVSGAEIVSNPQEVAEVLNQVRRLYPFLRIVESGKPGVEMLAAAYAHAKGLAHERYSPSKTMAAGTPYDEMMRRVKPVVVILIEPNPRALRLGEAARAAEVERVVYAGLETPPPPMPEMKPKKAFIPFSEAMRMGSKADEQSDDRGAGSVEARRPQVVP